MIEHERTAPIALTGNGDSGSVGRAAAVAPEARPCTHDTPGFVNLYSKFCGLLNLQKMHFSFSRKGGVVRKIN